MKKIMYRIYQIIMYIAMYFLPFRKPHILNNNDEVINVLKKKKVTRLLLVTDRNILGIGIATKLIKKLEENDITVVVYGKVVPNPTTTNVYDALNLYKINNCNCIISFGGGSSMDCAKAVAALITKPKKDIKKLSGILRILKRTPITIAVPTTAGTGSEATVASVITDEIKKEKYIINDISLIPHYALLDYNLTIGLPNYVTATTGVDALTHGIEAYIGKSNTFFTAKKAKIAIKLIFENLETVYFEGKNKNARKNMQFASFYAGMAFTKAYVGNIHALAHQIGVKYNLPHGYVNAVLLPIVLEYYGSKIHSKLAKIATYIGIDKKLSKKEKAYKLITMIKELNRKMNIPEKFDCLLEEDFYDMAKKACKEANPLYPVPVIFGVNEFIDILNLVKEEKEKTISEIVETSKNVFNSNITKNINYRIDILKKLKLVIKKYEEEIYEALKLDLNKSKFESYAAEIGFVYNEISYAIKNVRKLAKPKKVKTPLVHAISSSKIYYEPYGTVLVISPWNYPFLLSLSPVIGAIMAGNTFILKTSAESKNVSDILSKIIKEVFGDVTGTCICQNHEILDQKVDYIFFTGSINIGKLVMKKASEKLIPVSLELGGKSPCIVDETVDVKLAAKRIVWGKFMNAGQTCVAPDYVIVHESIKEKFASEVKKWIIKFYTKNQLECKHYPKIINEKHYNRLLSLIDNDKVTYGGKFDEKTQKISPTIMEFVTYEDKCMQEEIFGPILPIITYSDLNKLINEIKLKQKPLALYVFSNNKNNINKIINEIPYGGGCINDTLIHLATSELPFGGVGESGIGAYHGKYSFETFSNKKSILNKSNLIDVFLRYPPNDNRLGIIKKFMK